jgi:hypothetical protein
MFEVITVMTDGRKDQLVRLSVAPAVCSAGCVARLWQAEREGRVHREDSKNKGVEVGTSRCVSETLNSLLGKEAGAESEDPWGSVCEQSCVLLV